MTTQAEFVDGVLTGLTDLDAVLDGWETELTDTLGELEDISFNDVRNRIDEWVGAITDLRSTVEGHITDTTRVQEEVEAAEEAVAA